MAVGHRPGNLGELRNLELAIPTDRLIPEGDSMRGGTANQRVGPIQPRYSLAIRVNLIDWNSDKVCRRP